MDTAESRRPTLSRDLTGDELKRWYWLKDELIEFARSIGVRTTGSKDTVVDRLAATLDGVHFHEPESKRPSNSTQLSGPLTASTLIPVGQRCSQVVRGWFTDQLDESFSFDATMRAFFANTDGTQTLKDALDHYRKTRGQDSKDIDPQFEYNRFTRAWHESNPDGSRQELVAAWRYYRSLPVDQRGRI